VDSLLLSWQLRNFAREKRRVDRSWNVALRIVYSGDEETEEEKGSECMDFTDLRIVKSLDTEADRRNLLLLGLKCIRSMTPEKLAGLSTLTGVPAEMLERYATTLRARAEPRERRFECFRGRRNRAFSQSRRLETELAEEAMPERREALLVRLEKARKRMKIAMNRMSRVMLSPTNREITELLGLPKGTVDSGLFWLKRKIAMVYNQESQQSA
jgi:hypothetical protein